MKHYVIEEHSLFCKEEKNINFFGTMHSKRDFCHPTHILLFIQNNFIIISYNECLYPRGLDTIEEFIKCVLGGKYINAKNYSIERYESKVLEQIRKEGINYKRRIYEIHHVYKASLREKYLVSESSYVNILLNNKKVKDDYLKVIEYIKTKEELLFLIDTANRLLDLNTVENDCSEIEYIKTVSELSKLINKKCRNYETSKQ